MKGTQIENLGSLLKILSKNSKKELGCRGKDLDVIDKEVTTQTEEILLKASPKQRKHILRQYIQIFPFK